MKKKLTSNDIMNVKEFRENNTTKRWFILLKGGLGYREFYKENLADLPPYIVDFVLNANRFVFCPYSPTDRKVAYIYR